MKLKADHVDKGEYPKIVQLWETSVRATHHFLSEEDIQYFKPLILNTYLDAVELRCIREEQSRIVGFCGVASQNLEMLFIHPGAGGKGIGKTLLEYVVKEWNVDKVDVNEDNEQAVGFYEKFGFKTCDRSELDASGKPYPTLHVRL